jgi:hypothetical protein
MDSGQGVVVQQRTPFIDDPVDDRYRAAAVLSRFESLLWLDNVWTQTLERQVALSPRDLDALGRMTDEMRRLLEAVPADAEWLHGIAVARGEDLDRAAFYALETSTLSDTEKSELWEFVGPDRDYAASVALSCKLLAASWDVSADELAEEMRQVNAQEATPGDFRLPFRCAFWVAGAAAALIIGAHGHAIQLVALVLQAGCLGFLGPDAKPARDYLDELETLHELRQKGAITEKEFKERKAAIFARVG